MKRLLLLLLLTPGCQQQPPSDSFPYEFHAHQDMIWRCNKKTGEVDEAVSGYAQQGWHRVGATPTSR